MLIHDDGYQGNDVDIGRIILSKVTEETRGDFLLFAYSFKQATTCPDSTFAAFYMDLDANRDTGMAIDDIGADAVFLDLGSFDRGETSVVSRID